jgi:general secretion pathway protein F
MPAFRYEAVDDDGVTRHGVVHADSARAARSDLRTQESAAAFGRNRRRHERRKQAADAPTLRRKTVECRIELFTRQLASLLQAGLPLEQALTALLEQAERPSYAI